MYIHIYIYIHIHIYIYNDQSIAGGFVVGSGSGKFMFYSIDASNNRERTLQKNQFKLVHTLCSEVIYVYMYLFYNHLLYPP
jgi:galactokinase/mevalonate kinase-like predicted kinase